uniref:zinc finger matrin-type protein 1 isoform X2 n=1 Tax=Gasterosteus aculeatus aculeatus TaxID=481459 RepID=UPI001A99D7F3|nr:zinc finger matrin-type protein 1 isoform X2 [Gasterosteus aculeatus aculeatus]
MDDRSVCTPLLAESDTQNTTASSPNAASVTNAGKVINTQIDSTQVEGDERLEGLLTDDYCHVCEAVLLFESQRLSHYEGKKHAQKVKVYLQAERAEDMDIRSTGLQTTTTDKDRFCELCKMVFSSHVVAKSHYEGKVHAKNLRKEGPQPPVADMKPEVQTLPSLIRDPGGAQQKSAPQSDVKHLLDPAAAPSAGIDLKDPNKFCAMCAASFNNPQMALQHYNGRKHQRNQARQDLLRELGDDDQKANSLMCQMCSLQFNSVEMYQAHMQGNKHQIREKKVVNLCKSQQKDYNTFADELADYVQVQKARGITPKAGQVLPAGDLRTEGKEGDKEEEAFHMGDSTELNLRMPHLPPPSNPPHHSHPGGYYPLLHTGWRPPYQGSPRPSHHWDYSFPPAVPAGTSSPRFTNPPTNRTRRRRELSSSSCTTSSSYSSYSSSSSDSDVSEFRRREKRRTRTSGREGDRKARDEDSDKERKRRKRRRMERDDDEVSGESEKEGSRKKRKNHSKQRKRENKCREEDFEVEGGKRVTDNLMRESMMLSRKETGVHIHAEMNVEQGECGQDQPAKAKYRKENKKIKMRADTRSEEEKLWDDSILGC